MISRLRAASGPGRVDANLVQAFDRRQSFGADETPRFDVAARRTPDVHAGGEDSRLPGRLDEELDDQAVAVAGRCALERGARALAKHGSHRAADQQVVGVLIELAFRNRGGKQRAQARTRSPAFSARSNFRTITSAGSGSPRLRGQRSGPEERARQDEEPSDH